MNRSLRTQAAALSLAAVVTLATVIGLQTLAGQPADAAHLATTVTTQTA